MRAVAFLGVMLFAANVAADHASRDIPAGPVGPTACGATRVRDVRLTHNVTVDGFRVDLRAPVEARPAFQPTQAATTVILSAGRSQRVLEARGVGHVLRFDPGLHGDSFRVSFTHEPGSACVARVTLLSGDEAIAVVEP